MAQKKWQVEKVHYCEHVGQEVALEVEVVYPAEALPDQPPHVIAHRCSKALECNQVEKLVCAYCFTNPIQKPG
jgi:hypothetical protein